jgi:signal transduction histidine kinase
LVEEEKGELINNAHHSLLMITDLIQDGNELDTLKTNALITTNTDLIIFDLKGNAYSSGRLIQEIIDIPLEDKSIREINTYDGFRVIYDEQIYNGEDHIGWIRATYSMKEVTSFLKSIRTALYISIPVFILVALVGSLFLTHKSLSSIYYITGVANFVEKGEFDKRIELSKVDEEIGTFSLIFNRMLDKIKNVLEEEKLFTSNASHELKTPIAVISTQAESVLTDKSKKIADYKRVINAILKESKKMDFIISQLLTLRKGDEGKQDLNLELININSIVNDVVLEMRLIAKKSGIKISLHSKNDLKIKADQTLITMLIINLLKNSLKYNVKNGFVKINLFKENDFIKLIIEDNGIGISDKDMPYIFNRFFQSERSRTNDGAGLGLSIVKWITDIHKGKIEVKSKINIGTIFEISLPINL